MALTTTTKVRSMLPDSSADTTRLGILIDAYSVAIKKYCAREFEDAGTITRKFAYSGDGFLDLAPYELRTLTSIVAYTDLPSADQVTLAASSATTESDYRLMPLNKTQESTYLWVVLPPLGVKYNSSTGYPPSELKGVEVSVAGAWGMSAVPADVELACITEVINAYRNPGSFGSVSLGGYAVAEAADTFSLGGGANLSQATRALLSPYRRPAMR